VELDETHETARRELQSLAQRREKIIELERDRDALLESYVGMVPEALDSLTPQERHQIYKVLRLRVVAGTNGRVEVSGAFGDLAVCTSETWRYDDPDDGEQPEADPEQRRVECEPYRHPVDQHRDNQRHRPG
jgi:hypothetical protein